VHIRTFLNSDAPGLVELWRRQAPVAGRLNAVTPAMLETHVFSKLYWDPTGFFVAESAGRLLGAISCGFGPDSTGGTLNPRSGILSHWLIDSAHAAANPALWNAARDYFMRSGSDSISYGSQFPSSPFWSGFCGGTFVPGLVDGDLNVAGQLAELGFAPADEIDVLFLRLEEFKPPVDRRVVMARRTHEIRLAIDPPPENWWHGCVGVFRHAYQFRIFERKSNRACGSLSFCNTRPQDSGWDSCYMGIARIDVDQGMQRSGLGQAMLFEAIRDLADRGIIEIEAQVPRNNLACQAMLMKVGFRRQYSARQMHISLRPPA
jgi:GNAT superfamily N-acetyltransferase